MSCNKPAIYEIYVSDPLLILTVCVSSCVSTKQLTYLQEDGVVEDSLIPIQKEQEPYRLQVNDLLSIRVKAIDQETVGIFNPINDANPNATGEERLYYDGFVVDGHGSIRVPNLGEVDVLGLNGRRNSGKNRKQIIERLL